MTPHEDDIDSHGIRPGTPNTGFRHAGPLGDDSLSLLLRRGGVLLAGTTLGVLLLGGIQAQSAQEDFLERQRAAIRSGVVGQPSLPNAPRYVITATLSGDGRNVRGEAALTVTNTSVHALPNLVLRLYPNSPAIYGGSMTIDEVLIDGRRRQGEVTTDPTVYDVTLSDEVEPGDSLSARVSFNTEVPLGPGGGYGILATGNAVTRLAGWYPVVPPLVTESPAGGALSSGTWAIPTLPTVGDSMFADSAYFDVRLTAPADQIVVTTGSEVRRVSGPATTTWHFVSGPAREFAVVASSVLERRSATLDDLVVYHYTAGRETGATSAAEALSLAAEAVKVFESRFGPYPYAELDVVETDITIGGYEFPGLVMIDRATREAGARSQARWLIIHEVAHQWWYGTVGSPTITEPWLDEGFATYAVYLVLELTDPAAADAMLSGWRLQYGDHSQEPPVASPATAFTSWSTYRAPVYYRGALLLHDLRIHMGDTEFFDFLREIQSDLRYGRVTTGELADLADAHGPPGSGDVIRTASPGGN